MPLQQTVTIHLEQTGNTVAYNTVDLVARVEGFLTAIKYQDGAEAKRGDVLFVIEQPPYRSPSCSKPRRRLIAAQAELVRSEAELARQSTLRSQDISTQVALDKARAQRDTDKANVMSKEAGVTLAKINLGYTTVAAPFNGVVTKHLVSVGELVGGTVKTKLAAIVQLDPIYVSFNMSEQDLLRIRANLGDQKITFEDLQKVPIEVGLMTEEGFPYKGHLDYVAEELEPSDRNDPRLFIFSNPDEVLLPGFFVRIRVPTGRTVQMRSRCPIGRESGGSLSPRSQQGRRGRAGVPCRSANGSAICGSIPESGIKPDDRIIVAGIQRAIPGRKVTPKTATIASIAPAPAAGK